ncbi:hypothetical protein AAFF_G00305660 [Aldrovandia affinis]|uniref:Uncharacterized protein n=1 Tax=Aldrovandia affinis TaxID=143900 RepID=A0AAD7WRH2_9TELE|nr:hypothetical protein AAFF_G00305660 [Aldrovandia affinis]
MDYELDGGAKAKNICPAGCSRSGNNEESRDVTRRDPGSSHLPAFLNKAPLPDDDAVSRRPPSSPSSPSNRSWTSKERA